MNTERDHEDYAAWLAEEGYTDEQVRSLAERTSDLTDYLSPWLKLGESPIQGIGVFAAFPLNTTDRFAARWPGGRRTMVGRYTNHSPEPNCRAWAAADGGLHFCPLHDIASGEELTVNYRQVLAVSPQGREALEEHLGSTDWDKWRTVYGHAEGDEGKGE